MRGIKLWVLWVKGGCEESITSKSEVFFTKKKKKKSITSQKVLRVFSLQKDDLKVLQAVLLYKYYKWFYYKCCFFFFFTSVYLSALQPFTSVSIIFSFSFLKFDLTIGIFDWFMILDDSTLSLSYYHQ